MRGGISNEKWFTRFLLTTGWAWCRNVPALTLTNLFPHMMWALVSNNPNSATYPISSILLLKHFMPMDYFYLGPDLWRLLDITLSKIIGLPGPLRINHPIMICINPFASITEVGTLLTFRSFLGLVNFFYFFSGATMYIDCLDCIQLIFLSLILHTLTMPGVTHNTILLMRGPIRRIRRSIGSITNTHIAQNSITNSSQSALINPTLLDASLCIMRDDCFGVCFGVYWFGDVVVLYCELFLFRGVCMEVLGEYVVGLVGFMGDVFPFESDILRQIEKLIFDYHFIFNLLNFLSLVILIPYRILFTSFHIVSIIFYLVWWGNL